MPTAKHISFLQNPGYCPAFIDTAVAQPRLSTNTADMPQVMLVTSACSSPCQPTTYQHVLQLSTVLVAHQPVCKHTASLVQPQARQAIFVCTGGRAGHEHALELLAEVSQVECVVALGRSWQQLIRDPAGAKGNTRRVTPWSNVAWCKRTWGCAEELPAVGNTWVSCGSFHSLCKAFT